MPSLTLTNPARPLVCLSVMADWTLFVGKHEAIRRSAHPTKNSSLSLADLFRSLVYAREVLLLSRFTQIPA